MIYTQLTDKELSLVAHETLAKTPGEQMDLEKYLLEELVRRFDYLIASFPAASKKAPEKANQLELF